MAFGCILGFAFIVIGASAETFCQRSIPVRLNNYGPAATSIPILNSHVQTKPLERMPLRTAGCVPQARTVGNTCTCIKTIVKPQVHNQIISVPSVQRIIQTTATPVVEKIHYQATPIEPQEVCTLPGFFSGCLPFQGFARARCLGSSRIVSVPSCTCPTNAVII